MAPSPTTQPLRIGIVVTDRYSIADPDPDTPLLLPALVELGVQAQPVVWHRNERLVDFDLLALRSPWDYPGRVTKFLEWLASAAAQTSVVNSPTVVRWNLDKRYLQALAERGIAGIPTSWCHTVEQAAEALVTVGRTGPGVRGDQERVVVKPSVGAGAHLAGLFERTDPHALELAATIISRGGTAMIQPEVPELSEGREKALYLIDGQFTHAVAKGALLDVGGGLLGGQYQEHPERVEADDDEVALAHAVTRTAAELTGTPIPFQARIDTVRSAEHGLMVIEAELFEPSLNLPLAPDVVPLVAQALHRHAEAARSRRVGQDSSP